MLRLYRVQKKITVCSRRLKMLLFTADLIKLCIVSMCNQDSLNKSADLCNVEF